MTVDLSSASVKLAQFLIETSQKKFIFSMLSLG